jgi:hypothetical protein
MTKKVVVWGTGNVGRPAIRAVVAHKDLELVGVVVSNPVKVGKDAGELAGIDPVGVKAVDDWQHFSATDVDCLVYTANADTRGEEAFMELYNVLKAGFNVVSTAFYPLLYPPVGDEQAVGFINMGCDEGKSSVFISGVDPGWAIDILPILVSGAVSDIQEIRVQEIFNYGLYDQPEVVREVIGFGKPMDELPRMLEEISLKTVWLPMVQIIADALEYKLDDIETVVERRPLEKTIQVEGMGEFVEGTQGAFKFEVRGMKDGVARIVVEHITRIDDDCAPEWGYPPHGQGCHQVVISGNPVLTVSLHGEDPVEPGPAGGGNATAANRIVNAIPAVCEAEPGILSPLDLPPIHGGPQMRQ